MIQLNLLPDVKRDFLRAQVARRKTIGVSIMITIVAVSLTLLLAVYVYLVQNVILFAQTEDIKTKSSQLSSVEDINKYLTIQNQLANIDSLHQTKNNYSRLLEFLPSLNPAPPQNIQLTNLDVDSELGTITFKGSVTDYGSLTTFKSTLDNATFTYVDATGATSKDTKLFDKTVIESAAYEKTDSESGVNFSVVATYNKAVFEQQNTSVAVKVPNKETTQSVVGAPSIFKGSSN